jgi:recombination protein RecA
MAAKKKKRAVTVGAVDSSSPPKPKAAQKETKAKKTKKPVQGVYVASDFKTAIVGKTLTTGKGAAKDKGNKSDKNAPKRVYNPVEVLVFSDTNVIGHSAGTTSARCIALNKGTGIGGWPRGRIIEISGKESVGKTTVVLHAIAEIQSVGGVAMVVDVEHKWDLPYVARLGVDADALIVIQPARHTFEAVIDAMERALDHWVARGLGDIPLGVVWDSVGQTPSQSEFDKGTDEAQAPGKAAKLLKGAMRTLPERLARANATLFAVNQVYTKIVTGFAAKFQKGSQTITYGGLALRFASTLRIELVRTEAIKLGDGTFAGIEVLSKFNKNNVGVPWRNERFAIMWGNGIDDVVPLFWKLTEYKYITVGGGWHTFATTDGHDIRFQNSFIGFGQKLHEDPKLFATAVQIYNALP